MMKVAYLGPDGTFGSEAALSAYPKAELVPASTHEDVIAMVNTGRVPSGIVAAENSIGGPVVEVLDLLVKSPGLGRGIGEDPTLLSEQKGCLVIGEVVMPIHQCLFGNGESALPEARRVMSHPQGLLQCRRFISERLPGAELVSTLSTAAAVPAMLDSDVPAFAIAPRRAGELYERAVLLGENIEDNPRNHTRFLVIGGAAEELEPTQEDKTFLWFAPCGEDRPGTLVKVLQVFASAGVNMRSIHSRPMENAGLGVYVFIVELDGHWTDPALRAALTLIKEAKLAEVRIMGSYPRDKGVVS